ncbi:YscQ/HrcQ family type III secretion apparatus protein [Melaminivora suipulveris]|uniref:YscQ/HrcQ family type III secretion apparatus protein n=1 Tax=Melaminivora suipulveris TaxID=2109913 RepID=A0A2R3QFP9_9BURK|nr:type III secretion system cytoplasmic ring protein SctQ [Melaminivora suipulveris]AVO50572.1 YscQ/HrcQ family type III secretion apparatus protein [Melaminivora suipulveris]
MPEPHTTAAPVQPLPLSRAEAQARDAIAQRAIALPLALGASAWRMRLVPLVAPPPLAPPPHWLAWEWAGAQFVLAVPPQALDQLIAADLDHALLAELPPALAQSVLEAGLADVLQALQQLGRGVPRLLQWTPPHQGAPADLPPHAVALRLRAAAGPEAFDARLHADGLGLLLLAGLLAQRPPRPGPLQEGAVLALHAELGCTRVALRELQALAPGDVVLVQTAFASAERGLWLSADGRAGLHVQVPPVAPDGDAHPHEPAASAPYLTVVHPWSERMPAANPADDLPPALDAATLQELPVRLSFDLGELRLTLGELQALQPGQTLALAHPLAGAVRIRANGALVGEGDLVEIDGQLGVSVRSLWPAGDAP